MKRFLCISLIPILLLALFACGGTEPEPEVTDTAPRLSGDRARELVELDAQVIGIFVNGALCASKSGVGYMHVTGEYAEFSAITGLLDSVYCEKPVAEMYLSYPSATDKISVAESSGKTKVFYHPGSFFDTGYDPESISVSDGADENEKIITFSAAEGEVRLACRFDGSTWRLAQSRFSESAGMISPEKPQFADMGSLKTLSGSILFIDLFVSDSKRSFSEAEEAERTAKTAAAARYLTDQSALLGGSLDITCTVMRFEHGAELGGRTTNFDLVFAATEFETLQGLVETACDTLSYDGYVVFAHTVSDITGLACALYMRGARFAVVPTTLLAAVDASVGGKTALDIHGGKNLVGTVYQPCAVVCDTETLTSDMRSAFYPGMSEAVKHGVISGGALFDSIKDGGFAEDIPAFIAANVALKAKYVAADENDLGIRRVLNFGHTFAHAAEAAGGYTVAHCDSVALGMYCEALLAEHIGICRRGTAEEIAGIAGRYNTFPALPPRKALLEAMSHDKKFSGGRRVFALPERIGSVVLREVGFGELCSFLDKLYM